MPNTNKRIQEVEQAKEKDKGKKEAAERKKKEAEEKRAENRDKLTDIRKTICKNFKKNIRHFIYTQKDSSHKNKKGQREVAISVGVDDNTVWHWMNKDETTLPSVEELYALTNIFHITIDYMLNSHTERSLTYVEAFLMLYELEKNGAISLNEDIQLMDPFLTYLLSTVSKIDSKEKIEPEVRDQWFERVSVDYDHPIMSDTITKHYSECEKIVSQIDEYQEHLDIFHILCQFYDFQGTEPFNSFLSFREWGANIAHIFTHWPPSLDDLQDPNDDKSNESNPELSDDELNEINALFSDD